MIATLICSIFVCVNAQGSTSSLNENFDCTGMTLSWQGSDSAYCVQIRKGNTYQSCINTTTESLFVDTNTLVDTYLYYPTLSIRWQVAGIKTSNGQLGSFTQASSNQDDFFDVPWLDMSTPSQSFITSNNSQKISWSSASSASNKEDGGKSVSINGYLLEISYDGGSTYSTLETINSVSTTAWYSTVPGSILAYNTAYKIRITPKNICGLGRFTSNAVSFTTPGDVPQEAPTALTCTVNDGNTITFTWTGIGSTNNITGGFPVTSYQLEWSNLNGTTWWGNVQNTLSFTSTQTNAPNNGWYNYRVSAVNSKGKGVSSANVTILTPMVPPYIAPPTVGLENCTHIRLDWTAPNEYNAGRLPITNYQMRWKLSSKNDASYTNVPGMTSPYTQLNVLIPYASTSPAMTFQTLYDFQLASENSLGISSWSTVLRIFTPTNPGTMAAPTIATEDITPTKITIKWTALTTAAETGNCTITGYVLQYANTNQWYALTTNTYTSLSYDWTSGFAQNTNYNFRVTAYNGVGAGTASPNTTALTDTLPGQASTPTCLASDIHPTNITLNWAELTFGAATGRDTITYYKLEWWDQYAATKAWVTVNTVVNVTTTAMHTISYYSGLFPGGSTQTFRLSAMNGYGFGTPSANATCVCDNVPSAMGDLTATSVNPLNITVSWNDLTNSSNGGDVPVFYLLQYYNYNTNTWINLTVDGVSGKLLTFTHVVSSVFSSTIQQKYQVKPKNGVGWGTAFSNVLLVTTDKVPQQMSTVTVTSINPLSITISWSELSTAAQHGGDIPYYYQVEWLNPSLGSWVVLTNEAQGIFTTFTHTVSTIYASNSNQQYKVTPKNGVGWGIASSTVSCTADREPQAMNTPTVVSIDPLEIKIQWVDLTEPDNGRDLVTFYLVQWDQGLGTASESNWQNLNQESDGKVTSFTHTRDSIFNSNAYYNYRVRAKNGVGWGPPSAALQVQADTEPTAMNTPQVTAANTNPYWIYITWQPITTDAEKGRNEPIYYGLEWNQGPLNTWVNLTSESLGLTFDFNHTSSTPFQNNTEFKYRAYAKNDVGKGVYSTELSVTTDNTPTRMNDPTNGTVDYNSISLSWSPISSDADTGNDPVIYYYVDFYSRPCFASDSYDCSLEAADSGTWTELSTEASQGTSTTFTHTSDTHFHANSDHRYRICAKNSVGLGACSAELVVLTDDVPQQMSPPINVTVLYNSITIKWAVVTSNDAQGRSPITLYRVQWDTYANDSNTPWTTLGTVTQDENAGFLEYTHIVNPHFEGNLPVNYRIQAENNVGAGPWSDSLTLITDDVPLAMPAPIIGDSNITATQITIHWLDQALTDVGGDTIQYYSLEWDAGQTVLTDSDPWYELTDTNAGLVLEHTLNCNGTSFPNNTDFRFRLKSKNGVGFGPWSPSTTITTDRTPLQPQEPTNGNVDADSIELSWTLLTGFENIGRDPITHYLIEYFDGSSWSIVVETDESTTSYTHTISDPFPANTDRSDFFVKYRVTAKNGVGYGIPSTELSVLTDTYPIQMAPVELDGEITPLKIPIIWNRLTSADTDTGRNTIIKYRLYWQEEGTSTWVQLKSGGASLDNFDITNIPKLNTNFLVSVAAENNVGIGALSEPLIVLTDNVPTRMNTPEEDPSTNANFIKVTWASIFDEIDTGRDPVIYYKLEWDQGSDSWQTLTTPNVSVNMFTLDTANDGIQNGTSYKFRVTPLNRAGFGAVSNTITIIPSSPPDKMSMVTITPQWDVSSTDVEFSVSIPQTNGAPITSYIIKIQGKTGGNYYTELNECDGSSAEFVASRKCKIAHATLRAPPFNLQKGDNIVAIANAANLKGYNDSFSDPTDPITAYVEDIPSKMSSVTRNNGQTSWNKMTVQFNAFSAESNNAGGQTCSVLSYHVQRDQGNNTANTTEDVWTDIKGFATNDTANSVTTTAGIIGGTTYKVRVRALNKHGWGSWSSVSNIRCASVPLPPTSVTTTNSSLWIVVSWPLPENNGLDITKYKIEIARKSGSWGTSSECDGANNSTIVSTRSCMILMTTLRVTSTFNQVYNNVPVFRVFSYNAEGWSTSGRNSSGTAAIQTEPVAPPTTLTNDVEQTNDLQIKLHWSPITGISNWRGYEVHAYEVWWTDKDGTFSYELLYTDTKPFQLTYTHKNKGTDPDVGDTPYPTQAIVGGTRYKFKYRAVNIHGPGAFSVENLFYASYIPDQLDPVTTSLYNQTVTIQWNPTPNDHKQAVTAYRVKFKNKEGTFVEDTQICNGVKFTVVSALKCTALMTLFTNNLNLDIDDLIVAQVEAQNVMGYSIPSSPNTDGVLAKKLPQTAPSDLSRGENTGKTVIHLNWVGITANIDTGGQDVDYKVYYDKATGGSNWYLLTDTTTNLTTYTDSSSFTVGKAYQFKVAAFNDFGIGPQSNPFTVWAAIAPTGFAEPTTTLDLVSYVEEDDIILIDWTPPTDDGGLTVSYKIEVQSSTNTWIEVDQPNECSEKGTITNYFLPQATSANSATQCQILVSKLKSKWGLAVGATVIARITAFHVVGSVSSSMDGSGTAQIPDPPCFRTTFPRVIGGSNAASSITAIDIDELGNIVAGGYSQDSGLIGKIVSSPLPIVNYIAKGNYYAWGKSIETTDGISDTLFTQILDIAFRYDGQKIAMSLDRSSYGYSYVIVILNQDGSFYGAYRDNSNQRGKVNITSTLFDNSNFIILALDSSQDGTDQKKYAQIVRFSVNSPSQATISSSLYLQGGALNKISQSLLLQRIKSEPNFIYASAIIQDNTANRRSILAKITLTNGAIPKYFHYTTQAYGSDYNTDESIAGIRRMSLYEDDISTLQIVSACIVSQDGQRIHFGQFIFSSNQLFTVLTPSSASRWFCLGMFQRSANMAYTLINDRSANNPSGYTLNYGRIDYINKKIEFIQIVNHQGPNTYYGAYFVHMARFYYWGDTQNLVTTASFPFAQSVGFINIYDEQETYSCTSTGQSYSFSQPASTVTLDPIVSANMNWIKTGYTSGPTFAAQTGKSFRSITLSGGLFDLNLKEPISNNTYCPIVTNPTPATVVGPSIPTTMLSFDPDASSYPPQEISFTPFQLSKTCPDHVNYYSTFLIEESQPLPAFMTFDPENTKYIFDINNPTHVGTYNMILQATIGNNKTTEVTFRVQVASPCLGLTINVPGLESIPTYDISDLVPLYIDLNWEVVDPPTPSCGEIFFNFRMLNNTPGNTVVDTSVFSIVNTSTGLQQIKVWTQSIPSAKLWTDLQIEARLQGDIVQNHVYTILITNKCAVTVIEPVIIDDQVYYTGRDPIDFTFVWPETVGVCGPITYSAREYLIDTPGSNNTLDTGVFAYPKPSGDNNNLRIYTWDDFKEGIYQVRVWASLGVGGYKQSSTIFTVQIVKDPCSYFPYVTSFVEDLTLWINQTDQIVHIPPFVMNDTVWSCNFSYELRTGFGTVLDPIFVIKEQANEGDGTNITLLTTDKTKVDLSPQTVRVRGWPKRQNTTFLQFTFRIFVAYLDKTDCPSGQYYESVSETCQQCQSPCITCKTNPTTCTWCVSGYTFIEQTQECIISTALTECPTGTLRDPYLGFCRNCPDFCSACSSTESCTACVKGYYLGTLDDVNYLCYPPKACPSGYRADDALGCTPCADGCSSCPSSSICNLCKDGFYLNTLTQQCVSTCPDGYYADAASKVCMICSPACKTCVTNNYTCTSCQDLGGLKYYLFENTCVTRCPYIGYFQNEPARSCDPCKPACKICVNAIDDCIVCNTGSVISGRECLNSCPAGYYITVIGTCFQCDPSCQRCYGSQNSMCYECVEGQYLTQTTCENKCSPPLFPDDPTKMCLSCPYYCNQCTNANNCMKCKTGYKQEPQDCTGEMYLRLNGTTVLTVPLNTELVPEDYNPTSAAFELWFKADNIMSMFQEIILGLSPYKLRKKNGVAQIQLNFGDNNFCDSKNLKSDQWYHVGFSMTEDNGGSLSCFIDGELQNVGQVPVATITNDIQRFKEISFGTSIDIKTSETRFTGYIKEFRWWKKVRNQFQFINFKNVGLTSLSDFNPPNELLAYWKFDEKRSETKLTDFASKGTLQYDPTPSGFKVSELMEMREIYLKMCPEGTFIYFNETLGYYNCTECHPDCGNCNGETNLNCTSCIAPYKLLETEQKCIIAVDCPKGYWQDANKNCWPCHPYCTDCYGNDQFQCTACQQGFFKAYKRAGCVDACPRGLYGNYLTQSCSANPQVTSLYPEDGVVIQYGTFIDLFASYIVLNDEPRNTFTYGWIIQKLSDSLDIAKDATKTYAGEDILRVHLDNNIIEPNNYYNITFYVKGDETVYNGMIGSMFNVIYIGIPPKGGSCSITPYQGIAGATEFTIATGNWKDPDGISEFHFLYSLDDGANFLPIPQSSLTQATLRYVFDPIFKTINAKIKCEVKSLKGFVTSSQTSFLLIKKSSSNSKNELAKVSLDKVVTEQDSLRLASQLLNIAQDIGSLKESPSYYYDPKVNPDKCNDELCSFSGQCKYQTFTKQYYCDCYGTRAGRNCTFKNQTELEYLKNLTLENAKIYVQKASGLYNSEYLDMVTQHLDLMSDDLFDKVHDLVYERILDYQANAKNTLDTSGAQNAMKIVSNMLEYIDYDMLVNNVTGSWNSTNSSQTYSEKFERQWDNLNRTLRMVKMLQNSTLFQLNFLQTQIQMTSRKLAYKQVLTTKDKILSMPATDNVKKQFSTFVKISPANFLNTTVALNDEYIAETVEYSINPFQMNNEDRIATNIFEVNLYNQVRNIFENTVSKVEVKNLTIPIEFSFPASDNQNLTEFLKLYNTLNPFRNVEKMKREDMIVKSGLTCVYWDKDANAWSRNGCFQSNIDLTHIKCSCYHLSAFAIFFQTPKLSTEAPLLNNSTSKADSGKSKTLQLSDIIKWPLDEYLRNLGELWQHARPSFLGFIFKPGCIVLGLFWAMYFSSLVYYSGRDDLKRYKMTKAQNRDDLAELKDDEVQSLQKVIRDLIVRDFLDENGKYIAKEARRLKAPQLHKKQLQPPQIKIYEQLSKEEKKKYKKRARRKVFGVPAGLCDRARRFYDITMKHNATNPNAKMSFFNEELKNGYWIGLIAKTSKIAPRHVRLAMMYFYASLYIILLTIIFGFQLQEQISDSALFQVVVLSIGLHMIVWIIAIPVACIFRMPLELRRQIAGVRTKKINKAFKEVDKQMGCRYAIGYFICLTFYLIMTLLVLVFNMFYPQDYVIGWAFNIILLYIFDLFVFSFGLASTQMANIIISGKVKCWYKVWAAIEVFRYVKNLRG